MLPFLSMFCVQYFVKYTQWNFFCTAPTEESFHKFIHSLGKVFEGKIFLDFTHFSSIWRIRSRDKFIYAAASKTSPGNLLCYLLRTCFISGRVSVFFHYSFFEKYSWKIKSLEKVREPYSLIIMAKWIWKKKTFFENLLRNTSFQIMRKSLQLICHFVNNLPGALLLPRFIK